ncbi:universal stress protein [Halococcus sediminicola]|uniref:universal stress protein n=1 Tax=Halococcus sediminicola TaxID=1264579 RepID=UPI0009AE5C37|nr:universal stress protein [Halococcus sediminicola]
MDQHILVPIDGSEQASNALKYTLTHHSGEEIIIFHVINPTDMTPYVGMDGGRVANYKEVHSQRQEQAEQLLAEAKEQADENDVPVSTEFQTGDTNRAIVEFAEKHEIDHIIIGSHGRSGVSRILLGSVAEKVARRSPVPVTIVR